MNQIKSNSQKGSVGGVTLENINLSYGSNHVLKGIDLEIKPGEFFAFLGPSGCGKTTMLRLIAGFESAQTGKVFIGDKEVTKLPPWKRGLGMVFQSYALWPHMTIRKNVAFGLEERRIPKAEIDKRVEYALDLVSLKELADRRPSQLSGGQQQRVALTRTIVIEPKVLLLDEPLSNLDAKLRVQMRMELRQLQQKLGLTTIFVTHDQEEANTTSDRIAVINDGIIQQVGGPTDLYDDPANLFVANFLGVINVIPGSGEVFKDDGRLYFRSLDNSIVIPLEEGEEKRTNIIFRPQNLTIRPIEADPIDSATKLVGTVDHMEFLGGVIRYRVKVGEYYVLVDASHQRGSQTIDVGTKAALYLNNDQLIQIAD